MSLLELVQLQIIITPKKCGLQNNKISPTKIYKMKNIKQYFLFASIAVVAVSCSKVVDYKGAFTQVNPNNALLKINYLSAYVANPSVQLSIDGQRVSGLITGRTPFPGGGSNTNGSNFPDYLEITPGSKNLSIAIPKKGTNVDSVVLFTTTLQVAAGKNYTAHVSDTMAKTKSLLVEDDLSLDINPIISKYRFVNMMPNVPLADLYLGTDLVATKIPYLASSPYFIITFNSATSTTWNLRESGTSPTGPVLATYTNANTITYNRIYTVFSSGYKGQTATTTKPYVSFLLNK
jgi:hypothetical protein